MWKGDGHCRIVAFLSEKIEMKVVQGIKRGSYEYLKTVKVRDGKKLTSIRTRNICNQH